MFGVQLSISTQADGDVLVLFFILALCMTGRRLGLEGQALLGGEGERGRWGTPTMALPVGGDYGGVQGQHLACLAKLLYERRRLRWRFGVQSLGLRVCGVGFRV